MSHAPRVVTGWEAFGLLVDDDDPVDVDAPVENGDIELEAGTIIPGTNFQIERRLGAGAMGEVYAARHLLLGREMAIKVIAKSLCTDRKALERFQAEARTSAQIGSAHIVDVFDFAGLPDGRAIIAMERLVGPSLAGLVEAQGPLAPARAIVLLRQICKALDAAHRVGVVHRDVKPENVMLAASMGRREHVKLLDFGVAAMAGGAAGAVVGTPLYVSPEAIRAETVDARSDIYSLGCTAYELLTGEPPFDSEDLEVLLAAQLEQPAPRLPGALGEVVGRCLEKDPAQRYATAADLEHALCDAQLRDGLSPHRGAWLELPGRDVAQRRELRRRYERARRPSHFSWSLPVAALSGALLVAGAGWSFMSPPNSVVDETLRLAGARENTVELAMGAAETSHYLYPPASDPERMTAYQLVLALEATGTVESWARAQLLRSDFASRLEDKGDELWDERETRGFARDFYMQSVIFHDDPTLRARTGATRGEMAELRVRASEGTWAAPELAAAEVLQAAGEAEPRRPVSQERRERLRRPGAGPSPIEAETSQLLELASDAVANPALLAVPITTEAAGDTTESVSASALVKRARRAMRAGKQDEAERLLHRALDRKSRYAPALISLGDLYFEQAHYGKAARHRALAAKERPNDASVHLVLGDAYFKSAAYSEARVSYQRALALGEARAKGRLKKLAARTE